MTTRKAHTRTIHGKKRQVRAANVKTKRSFLQWVFNTNPPKAKKANHYQVSGKELNGWEQRQLMLAKQRRMREFERVANAKNKKRVEKTIAEKHAEELAKRERMEQALADLHEMHVQRRKGRLFS